MDDVWEITMGGDSSWIGRQFQLHVLAAADARVLKCERCVRGLEASGQQQMVGALHGACAASGAMGWGGGRRGCGSSSSADADELQQQQQTHPSHAPHLHAGPCRFAMAAVGIAGGSCARRHRAPGR